ncbi:MAG: transposase [Clostridia bacterium]|nr:transposase [Clostridia bacterium]MBQ7613141.1 transposase [Spirochaetaceae bacterium]
MRDQKKSKRNGIREKRRHTQKVQIVAHAQSKDILSVDFAKGSVHDKKIFDESGIKIDDETLLKGDSGYQGIQKRVQRCDLPIKKVKGKERSQDEKEFNKEVAKERVFIEHINRYIKRFRIFSTHYRNGLEGFSCKFTLICGIYNLQH